MEVTLTMKKPVVWFLVVNETRLRLHQGLSPSGVPPTPELVIHSVQRNLRDVLADWPGRSFSSGSAARRSSMENGTDPRPHDRMEFLRQTFAMVDADRRARSFDRLVIVAGPRMLGLLLGKMPKSSQVIVSRKIAPD